ncbi:MAG: calcium/sodium antiporter [Flavipsychrobacter sp.]|nr:calcium/sodium antiporter [Flavipsychrobacter sp.]
MTALLFLLLGFLLAGLGGEAFVRGSVSLSNTLRIPTAVIGVTVAAFATSSPELSVAVNAAIAGKPQIALGDGLGSNVVNVSLVLGIALCFGALPARRAEVRRDWVIAMFAPILTGLFAFDGEISRIDGFILLGLFSLWLIKVVVDTRNGRSSIVAIQNNDYILKSILFCIIGIGLLIGAGLSIVHGAKEIGVMFNIPAFIVGATLVALGTSMPELATTIIARMRGHNDLGLGTILGSNIFNVFVIIATAAVIHPITVSPGSLWVVLGICFLTTLLTWPTAGNIIPRWRGYLFVVIYALYVIVTLQAN